MAKYLYCITKPETIPALRVTGLEDKPVEFLRIDDMAYVVSDTSENQKELTRDAAIAHEKVLESVMEHTTILPVAFGHVVGSEKDLETGLFPEHREKILETLSFLEGKIELSLKAFWLDLTLVLRTIAEKNIEIKRMKARGRLGRDEAIRAGQIAEKALKLFREKEEAALTAYVQDLAIDSKECKLFGEQMIANRAFLIEKDHLETFDARVNAYEEEVNDANMKFKYTGPVPPFNFVNVRIQG